MFRLQPDRHGQLKFAWPLVSAGSCMRGLFWTRLYEACSIVLIMVPLGARSVAGIYFDVRLNFPVATRPARTTEVCLAAGICRKLHKRTFLDTAVLSLFVCVLIGSPWSLSRGGNFF